MDFAIFFAMQFIQYLLITVNYRAIAAAKYGWTAISDLAFATIGFLLIRKVAQTDSLLAWAGYVAGGVFGSMAGIWVSKKLWKEAK